MATFGFNYIYFFDNAGTQMGSGNIGSDSATDGEGDNVFDTGDTLTSPYVGTPGPYSGTQVLNGTNFVFHQGDGGYYAYGNVPGSYTPVSSFNPGALDSTAFVVCFAAGTRILTDRGEVAVESLRAGDLVATLGQGGAPFAPVLFVGHRRIRLAGHPQAADLAPIRIRAGALAENTPMRDLLVSPDHGLLLDGALVPARLLVNGGSICVEQGLAEVTYFHIELPRHDVVLAEGAAAESWLDAGNRTWFANAPAALLRVDTPLAAQATRAVTPCAPLVQGGPQLAAIRDRIAAHWPAALPRAA